MAAYIPAVWGIDVGMCALKAIKLEVKEGQVVATAFEYIEHPKILSQPDANPEELITQALQTFLSRNQVKGDAIAISEVATPPIMNFVSPFTFLLRGGMPSASRHGGSLPCAPVRANSTNVPEMRGFSVLRRQRDRAGHRGLAARTG